MRYRWFADDKNQTDELGIPVSRAESDEALQPKKPGYKRGELLAIVIAMVILLYEWSVDDTAMIFVCVAFLTFELKPIILLVAGKQGIKLCNVLTGFSLAMFVATLVWIFLN